MYVPLEISSPFCYKLSTEKEIYISLGVPYFLMPSTVLVNTHKVNIIIIIIT